MLLRTVPEKTLETLLEKDNWDRLIKLKDEKGGQLTKDDIVKIAANRNSNQVLETLLEKGNWDSL